MSKTLYKNARDWMGKVDRQIAELVETPRSDSDGQRDNATDSLVALWQAIDYINQDITPTTRAALAQVAGKADLSLGDLQAYLRARSDDLLLCQQVANASKHSGYHGHHKKHEDTTINVTVSAAIYDAPSSMTFAPKITMATGRLHMIDVAQRACDFLMRFMNEWKIGV